ncbi:hypothetical protein [Staphylococcus simulans]|nr:hypothetical protein [Staphylococcus simulans]
MNIDNVSTLSKAENAKKVAPKPIINGLISLIVGLIIALIIVTLKELLDRRIKTEKEVEEVLGLPVLGSISDFGKKK